MPDVTLTVHDELCGLSGMAGSRSPSAVVLEVRSRLPVRILFAQVGGGKFRAPIDLGLHLSRDRAPARPLRQ
jgi:hypothetical protein